MDDLILDDNIENTQVNNNKTPVFILVLCILTYVGASLFILGSFYWYIIFNMGSNSFGAKVYPISSLIMAISANLLCLGGAIFMHQLKKIGFYLYLAGQVLAILNHLLFWSKYINDSLGMMSFFMFYMFFPIVFIILYAVNFKHLK